MRVTEWGERQVHIWESDQISIRVDKSDRTTTLETNSGGFLPSYVSIHLNENELDELINALNEAKLNLNHEQD